LTDEYIECNIYSYNWILICIKSNWGRGQM